MFAADSQLAAPDAERLLELARASLESCVRTGSPLEIDAAMFPEGSMLREPLGAFVSLHTKAGELRGCVGSVSASRPLAQTVVEMAQAAACRDHRFDPLRPDELANVVIEISVLGAAQAVSDLSEVVIGRDGLLVSGNGRRGVLLPQVASEREWDAATFAEQACLKAGLPADAWKSGVAALFRFRGDVFTEPLS